MKNLNFYPTKIEEQEEGGFLASCPTIQGAWAEGDTIEDAVLNLQDVVSKILEYRKKEFSPLSVVKVENNIRVPNLALAVEL
ncbi:type II toxin-antitoxin system HicB family antitoxin [Patescibacteria group bacterium]|nr:type II toxin-antitoxin system HicB family antitoxin [Patescibacteria group bacterium]MBU4512650.1 type II toxin-antitoxin system HicB family antitoxin [Patescibacteria group bacterium]MCG2693556.1 type II toxin-antitoxin system HicB family antitoxin [Candidatus Parcubacteria bacterium]